METAVGTKRSVSNEQENDLHYTNGRDRRKTEAGAREWYAIREETGILWGLEKGQGEGFKSGPGQKNKQRENQKQAKKKVE